MATLQTNPDPVPDDAVEWTRELNISKIGRVGYINIELDPSDDGISSIPDVLAGSKIEINNSVYVEESDVAIDDSVVSATDEYWLIYEVSGTTATAKLTSVEPTASNYDVTKGGFYNASGDRYTGHYFGYSTVVSNYVTKGILSYDNGAMLRHRTENDQQEYVIDSDATIYGDVTISGDIDLTSGATVTGNVTFSNDVTISGDTSFTVGTSGVWNIAPSATYVIPNGLYNIVHVTPGGIVIRLEIYASGAWRQGESNEVTGTIISDGTNTRLVNISASTTRNVYYQRY